MSAGFGYARFGGSWVAVSDDPPVPWTLPTAPYNAAAPQVTPTYDGSGQVVHPDVLYVPTGWNGYDYWLAVTPYPASNDDYENASILASHDGQNWVVPAGLTNPISPEPVGGHSSDPDLILDGATMWCVYRDAISGTEYIRARSSTDGLAWSAPSELFSNAGTATLLSPTVVWDGTQWVCWTIDAIANVCRRRTAPAVTGPWSAPSAVTMAAPVSRILWHIDVLKDADGYHALLDTADDTSGAAAKLHLARSTDGLTWTVGPVVIDAAGSGAWDDELIYRGTFVRYGSVLYRVWYSARKATNVWRLGYTEIPYAEAPAP